MIGNYRLQPCFRTRPAEASRVCELKADNKVSPFAEAFAVSLDHLLTQVSQRRGGALVQEQLVRVRTRLREHRHGFSSPDQFGPAAGEPGAFAAAGAVANQFAETAQYPGDSGGTYGEWTGSAQYASAV